VFDGLRLVSLARAACEARGWDAASRLVVVQHDRVATFLLKKSPFTEHEIAALREHASRLQFRILYAPGPVDSAESDETRIGGTTLGDYPTLITTADPEAFYRASYQDVTPTTDDRPFFFHTTKLAHQFQTAFGRSMLFGNGLSALLTLMAISTLLVGLFVVGPLALAGGYRHAGWRGWLCYFGCLGAGFMLIEVAVLQRLVLLLGHPVYSLTITLFSLLLGTGMGAALSRRLGERELRTAVTMAVMAISLLGILAAFGLPSVITWAMPFPRELRIAVAIGLLVPLGLVLGIPMPAGIRLLSRDTPQLLTWAWGINGALSVLGATLAIFVAMNWGFGVTLLAGAAVYLVGLGALAFTRVEHE
jgi:hypothetical protein